MKKKSIYASMIALLIIMTVFLTGCRKYHTPEKRAERMTSYVSSELDLNNEQKAGLKTSITKLQSYRTNMFAIRNMVFDDLIVQLESDQIDKAKLNGSINKAKSEMEAIIPVFVDELATFHKSLNPEQRAKLVEILKEKREKYKNGRHGHHHF